MKLAHVSKLPDECRAEVEDLMHLLKEFERAEETGEMKRRSVMMKMASSSAKQLAKWVLKLQASNVLPSFTDREGVLASQLEAYARYLDHRIKNFKPGPKHDGIAFVIGQLNFLLIDYSGRGLHRGNESQDGFSPAGFVELLFKYARSNVTGQLLDTLIKQIVTEMGGWGAEYRPGDEREVKDDVRTRDPGWMFNA